MAIVWNYDIMLTELKDFCQTFLFLLVSSGIHLWCCNGDEIFIVILYSKYGYSVTHMVI